VPGYFNARVATARSLFVVTAIAVMSIALVAVPIRRDPIRCAEQPGVTVQPAVAGTLMRLDRFSSVNVNGKK
jgi:hypothetical protein